MLIVKLAILVLKIVLGQLPSPDDFAA